MPQKLGNGGHSQENYDPNTGKYISDGEPNKYYDNPNEEIDSAATQKQIDFLTNFLQQKNIDIDKVRVESKQVPQWFIDKLKRKLDKNFLNTDNNDVHRAIFDGIIENLEIMDKNDFQLFIRTLVYVSDVVPVDSSCYIPGRTTVGFDFESINSTNEKNKYGKNEVFFHEFGHAMDNMIKQRLLFGDDYDYSPYISENFISSKYKKTMFEMLKEEFSYDVREQIVEEEKNYFQNDEFPNIHNTDELLSKIQELGDDYLLNVEDIKKDITQSLKNILGLDSMSSSVEYVFEYYDEKKDKNNPFKIKIADDLAILFNDEHDFLPTEKEKRETMQKVVLDLLKNKQIKQKIKKINSFRDEQIKLNQLYKDVYIQKTRVWGSISDSYESITNKTLTCGMGHGTSYWKKASHKKAAELFANLFSAKTSSEKTYELYKKYCPKTVEIFEELLTQAWEVLEDE